jgi:hypothetical protein
VRTTMMKLTLAGSWMPANVVFTRGLPVLLHGGLWIQLVDL